MDLKKEAAVGAFDLVRNHSSIGLGAGRTVACLAKLLRDGIWNGLEIDLYTSSFQTAELLQEAGITVHDISMTDRLDQYFDGCDLVDNNLNALKSGAGIHTAEKLFASMADEFIILAEDPKFVSVMDPKIPLVIEVFPQAVNYIMKKIKQYFSIADISLRDTSTDKRLFNMLRGNQLMDLWFTEWPELSVVQNSCKNISGVVEISLFYQMAHKAIIGGNNGIRIFKRMDKKAVI